LKSSLVFLTLAASAVLCCAQSTASKPIQLAVDIGDAARKIFHAQLLIPVKPGPLTLQYPEWIPGEHGPTGPIDNLAGLRIEANGQPVPWKRDNIDMFAFHLTVPDGVSEVRAKLDFLATAQPSGFSAGASTSANLAIVSWNEFTLYPAGMAAADIQFEPSITLPDGWKSATALTEAKRAGNIIHFQPLSLEMLVDSPLLAGRFFKEIPLASEITPKHYLDLAADGPEDLAIGSEEIESFSNLIRESGALYNSRHYNSYHFLMTLSDSVAHFGLEHHQSSDDRVDARTFIDEDMNVLSASLLPHEFTHSWNGKYRRPAGLATTNYQQPMKGDLLWVYEGLTEYASTILSVRCGLWNQDQFLGNLAETAAEMNTRPGRTWRDLEDTAVAAQTLYTTTDAWDNWRRSVDYYPEGALIWLDADVTIRKLSKGKRSLNDFCARFLGEGGNSGPKVVPYTFDSMVAVLNAVEPYDWAGFFNQRLTSLASTAPLDGITNGGYKLEYTDTPNEITRHNETYARAVNAWYSLGFKTADQSVQDVLIGGLADRAGLGPGMKLVAINGRKATDELLHNAIKDAKDGHDPIELIVENQGFFKVIKLDYHAGEKYPRLAHDGKSHALLDDLMKPMVVKAKGVQAE
jgi:predicted metalloprotease with PDZ domain